MTKILEQLEPAIETEEDDSLIKELMEQTDGRLTECMISVGRKVQPSARA